MRVKLSSGAATVLFGALFVASASAQVPVPESPPLSCSTANFTVTTNFVPQGSAQPTQYPILATCGGLPCTDYGYRISSPTNLNVDHAVFAVSATQDVFDTTPASFESVPGDGDNTTGFLARAHHEYTVRFNSSNTKSVEAHIRIHGPSTPRVGTVVIRSGAKLVESCMIATPGVAGDTFQPVFQTQQVTVAGGKCTAILVFDSAGNVVDVTSPNCVVGSPSGGQLFVGTEPIKNNSGPHGITFGTGTTTCYGPPRPDIPKCVCVAAPCP